MSEQRSLQGASRPHMESVHRILYGLVRNAMEVCTSSQDGMWNRSHQQVQFRNRNISTAKSFLQGWKSPISHRLQTPSSKLLLSLKPYLTQCPPNPNSTLSLLSFLFFVFFFCCLFIYLLYVRLKAQSGQGTSNLIAKEAEIQQFGAPYYFLRSKPAKCSEALAPPNDHKALPLLGHRSILWGINL